MIDKVYQRLDHKKKINELISEHNQFHNWCKKRKNQQLWDYGKNNQTEVDVFVFLGQANVSTDVSVLQRLVVGGPLMFSVINICKKKKKKNTFSTVNICIKKKK